MGQKTSYPIIPGIWFSTRANLMGTWGLRRHAVDVAPDGMGWEWGYRGACGEWSGQDTVPFICLEKKGVPWTIQEIKHFPIMIGMTDQRK